MIARDLAHAGYVAYASMRDTVGKNAARVAENDRHAREHGVELRSIELDKSKSCSADDDNVCVQEVRAGIPAPRAGQPSAWLSCFR
jgi:hypothetical protein